MITIRVGLLRLIERTSLIFVRHHELQATRHKPAGLQKNADGSIDIYFGADAPAGKESNWVPTDPTRKFELMFRLYAPTKALFDKTWQLADVEKVK